MGLRIGARLVKEGLGGIPTHAAMLRPHPFTALLLASLGHSERGQIIQERGYIPHGGERPRDGKIPRGGAQPRALTVADEGRVHHVDVNSHRLERPGSLVAPGLGRGGGLRGGSPWHDGREGLCDCGGLRMWCAMAQAGRGVSSVLSGAGWAAPHFHLRAQVQHRLHTKIGENCIHGARVGARRRARAEQQTRANDARAPVARNAADVACAEV